jgi:hypothetical protein
MIKINLTFLFVAVLAFELWGLGFLAGVLPLESLGQPLFLWLFLRLGLTFCPSWITVPLFYVANCCWNDRRIPPRPASSIEMGS